MDFDRKLAARVQKKLKWNCVNLYSFRKKIFPREW